MLYWNRIVSKISNGGQIALFIKAFIAIWYRSFFTRKIVSKHLKNRMLISESNEKQNGDKYEKDKIFNIPDYVAQFKHDTLGLPILGRRR